MKKWFIIALAVVAVAIGTTVWLSAAPSVGTASATPAYVVINTPTTVLIAISITDPSLLPNGVNLLRTDAAGKTLAIVGVMRDDGTSGDATANDKRFTYRLTVNQAAIGQVFYRTSAAFKGVLLRTLSNVVSVTIDPFSLPPDPGEAGKQTLEGIDSDRDGVRDDVQRWISLNITTEAVRLALRDAAAALQLALVAITSNEEELRAASTAQGSAALCLVFVTKGLPTPEQVVNDLSDRVLNTSLRRDAYTNYKTGIRSLKLGRQASPPSSEFGSFCTFNPSVVAN